LTDADKKKVRQKLLLDFFIRYGAGADHWKGFTARQGWNWIAWGLIVVGVAGWVAFLSWNP
jgi:hypothetical protein